MGRYIFITDEGFTFQPGSEDCEPDIENMQVIGFGEGSNAKEAFTNLINTNPYLKETSFNKVAGIEIAGKTRAIFYLKKCS